VKISEKVFPVTLLRSGALSSNTRFPDAFAKKTCMHNESKPPKISEKEAEALAKAGRLALGEHPIDGFIDLIFECLRMRRQRREQHGEWSFPE